MNSPQTITVILVLLSLACSRGPSDADVAQAVQRYVNEKVVDFVGQHPLRNCVEHAATRVKDRKVEAGTAEVFVDTEFVMKVNGYKWHHGCLQGLPFDFADKGFAAGERRTISSKLTLDKFEGGWRIRDQS